MNHFKAVAVKILNKEFQVSCPPGSEEQLFEAAHYLDQQMRGIRKNGRVIGAERIAIMAALNIAHELLVLRQQKDADTQALTEQIDRLQNKIDSALMEEIIPENAVESI